MPYSKQSYNYTTGARTFTLSLASGYDFATNISVYVEGELDGGGAQIFRTFTFDSEFVINVTDSIANPSVVVILRTVSPTVFSVDFEAGDDVTKRNLQLAFRQQFFLMQEILDGRVDGVDIVAEAANAAAAAQSAFDDAASAAASAAAAAASAASIDTDDLVRKDGTTAFTAPQTGVAPTVDLELATKKYVDDVVGGGGAMLLDGTAQMTAAMLLVAATPTLDDHATRKKYVDDLIALQATVASPTFTGVPAAPTASVNTNTTQLATTAFVVAEIADGGANAFAGALLHVKDEKSSGTNGGTFTSGAWRKRDLNTVLTNEISGASVSSSVITLPDGEYFIMATCPTYSQGGMDTQHRLRNTSSSTTALKGTSQARAGSSDVTDQCIISGRFTATGTDNFELQGDTNSTNSNTGFGAPASTGIGEVYSDVKIWKVG